MKDTFANKSLFFTNFLDELLSKFLDNLFFIHENKISFLKALDNITNTENYLAYKIGCNKLLIDFVKV